MEWREGEERLEDLWPEQAEGEGGHQVRWMSVSGVGLGGIRVEFRSCSV